MLHARLDTAINITIREQDGMRYRIFGRRTGLRVSELALEKVSEVSLGVPHEVHKSTAARMAGGKPKLLDWSSIPVT